MSTQMLEFHRGTKRKYLDIPYATLSPLQKLDIYLPDEGDDPFPVIVSIHGGAFMGCDKSDMQVLPMLEGLKRGHTVVAVNYRLSWEAMFPALVHDVKAATPKPTSAPLLRPFSCSTARWIPLSLCKCPSIRCEVAHYVH